MRGLLSALSFTACLAAPALAFAQEAPAASPEAVAIEQADAGDPWEGFNRRVHTFNNAIDRAIAKPLAKAYMAVVPRPVRLGVSNFFSNLGQPLTMVNSLLQGRPKQAAQTLGRFALNTTLGIGGIFDPATEADLPRYDEDFGQTLGQWGWKRSNMASLSISPKIQPLTGPSTWSQPLNPPCSGGASVTYAGSPGGRRPMVRSDVGLSRSVTPMRNRTHSLTYGPG